MLLRDNLESMFHSTQSSYYIGINFFGTYIGINFVSGCITLLFIALTMSMWLLALLVMGAFQVSFIS